MQLTGKLSNAPHWENTQTRQNRCGGGYSKEQGIAVKLAQRNSRKETQKEEREGACGKIETYPFSPFRCFGYDLRSKREVGGDEDAEPYAKEC